MNFNRLFDVKKPVIGMIHLNALPGTPHYSGNVKKIINKAIKEADIYLAADIDSIAIENMHDTPYLKRDVGHEITALMSIIGYEIKKRTKLPIGIQILAGANKQAIAAANAAGLDFIRAEGFVYGHLADEGIMESDAGELLRYRRNIGAENILVFTDIKKKHSSHSLTQDISAEATALAAEFFHSDGIILTGNFTGDPTDINLIKSVKKSSQMPILIGSGVDIKNISEYYQFCDGFIIGSYFKKGGNWQNNLDKIKVNNFMKKMKKLRGTI